jgi:hypothetical protein
MTSNGKPGRYTIEHSAEKPAAMQFMEFKYVISTSGTITPNDEGFEAMFENAVAVPINCGQHLGTCPCTCTTESCTGCGEGKHSECIGTGDAKCTACDAGKCGI